MSSSTSSSPPAFSTFPSKDLVEDNNLMHLNVGGTYMATQKSTLCSDSNSVLSAMFNGNAPISTDNQGRYFLDRDPENFRELLNYLRDGSTLQGTITEALKKEAKFFQVKLQLQTNEISTKTFDDIYDYLEIHYYISSGNAGDFYEIINISCSDNQFEQYLVSTMNGSHNQLISKPMQMKKFLKKHGWDAEFQNYISTKDTGFSKRSLNFTHLKITFKRPIKMT